MLFEADAAHSLSTVARRSNLADYSRDEKKAACEKKTGRRREKREEESMKGNEEENAGRSNEREEIKDEKYRAVIYEISCLDQQFFNKKTNCMYAYMYINIQTYINIF